METPIPHVQPGGGYTFVTVKPGDSLWSLAHRHTRDNSWQNLYNENTDSVRDVNNLTPGTTLRVPEHNRKG